jgi:hypothetical protein
MGVANRLVVGEMMEVARRLRRKKTSEDTVLAMRVEPMGIGWVVQEGGNEDEKGWAGCGGDVRNAEGTICGLGIGRIGLLLGFIAMVMAWKECQHTNADKRLSRRDRANSIFALSFKCSSDTGS